MSEPKKEWLGEQYPDQESDNDSVHTGGGGGGGGGGAGSKRRAASYASINESFEASGKGGSINISLNPAEVAQVYFRLVMQSMRSTVALPLLPLPPSFLLELLACFLLFMLVSLAALSLPGPWGSEPTGLLAIATLQFAAIIMLGGILFPGTIFFCHPSVTLASVISGHVAMSRGLVLLVAQGAGGLLGSAVGWLLASQERRDELSLCAEPTPSPARIIGIQACISLASLLPLVRLLGDARLLGRGSWPLALAGATWIITVAGGHVAMLEGGGGIVGEVTWSCTMATWAGGAVGAVGAGLLSRIINPRGPLCQCFPFLGPSPSSLPASSPLLSARSSFMSD